MRILHSLASSGRQLAPQADNLAGARQCREAVGPLASTLVVGAAGQSV